MADGHGTHYRPVVMVNGGLTQVQARQTAGDWAENPQTLDGPRSLRRDAGDSQGPREKNGHESSANIVAVKSALKRLANKDTGAKTEAKLHPVSKSAVHCYLRHCLQLKQLELRRRPRRLDLARARLNWLI